MALQASLPLRIVDTRTDFTDLDGDPISLDHEKIHHRDETIVGIGDVQLLLHAGRRYGRTAVGARIGLSLPTGKVNEDPFRLGADGKRHQHIQLGTGTFDPVLALDVGQPLGDWSLASFLQVQMPLYEGRQGYRAGTRTLAGLSVSRPLGGVSVPFGADMTASIDVNVRAYGRAEGAQLDMPVVVSVSIGRLFHLESGDHDDHDDDHEDDHGAGGGGDVQDAVMAGELRELLPVPGKWTVFDFWAAWCEPCHDLDARLRSLAAEHADVAIRRVNIVDSDSPIARREMHGATTIPRVRLIDPQGKTVWEESGPPADLIDGIRERIGR